MNFLNYQAKAHTTAKFPNANSKEFNLVGVTYCALGLTGEAGEIANKLKKFVRGDYGEIKCSLNEEQTKKAEEVSKELGDCLWYIAELATQLGLSLEDIAEQNLKKLSKRDVTNTIKGAGDNREETSPPIPLVILMFHNDAEEYKKWLSPQDLTRCRVVTKPEQFEGFGTANIITNNYFLNEASYGGISWRYTLTCHLQRFPRSTLSVRNNPS